MSKTSTAIFTLIMAN